MSKYATSGRNPRAAIYLPIADEQATGMQRFGSEIIQALLRLDPGLEVVIGRVDGQPAWLAGIGYHEIFGRRAKRWVPRAAQPLLRLLWLQFVLPVKLGRGATLLSLAHELPVVTILRQIAVAHDLTHMRSYAPRRGILESIRHRLWTLGLRRADRVIAISHATRRDLVELCRLRDDRISVIYEGFDPAIFHPSGDAPPRPRPFLLYAGTLAPNKNIPFLLQVFSRVRQRHDVDLVLVGKHSPDAIAALLSQLPESVRGSIDFPGFVTDEQLAALMRHCRAFTFPSLNEGFGLAVVEAMACGAPLISSPAGSLAEVVESGGLLLDPNAAEAWVAAVDRVLLDEQFRTELSQKGLQRSAQFSWEQAAQAYLLEVGGAATSGNDRNWSHEAGGSAPHPGS